MALDYQLVPEPAGDGGFFVKLLHKTYQIYNIETPEYIESLRKRHDYVNSKVRIGEGLLYLSRRECADLAPSIDETMAAVREALVEHGHKRYEMPAKVGVHPLTETFYNAMPSYVPGNLTLGIKWIEGYPRNPQEFGLPQTTGLIILNDILTGLPVCVMDCTTVTSLRTPAVTMLSALELHPDAESIMMVGLGVQGTQHVRFFLHTMKNLKRIYINDSYKPAEDKLAEAVMGELGDVELIRGKSFEEMTKSSDIICTATKSSQTPAMLVRAEWAQRGQTYLPQESFSAVDPQIGELCDRFITDSTEEAKLFEQLGIFPLGLPPIACETGEMLAGLKEGRQTKDQIIVCDNIGMAVEDMAVAKVIYDNALAAGAGTVLEL